MVKSTLKESLEYFKSTSMVPLMSAMSSHSKRSRPMKLSFDTEVNGLPANLRMLRWSIVCQALDGGELSRL